MSSTKTINSIRSQVKQSTPPGIIQIIATQTELMGDAAERIKAEGIVVRDLKGSVIPHPAIKIESDASKVVSDLLAKHARSRSHSF